MKYFTIIFTFPNGKQFKQLMQSSEHEVIGFAFNLHSKEYDDCEGVIINSEGEVIEQFYNTANINAMGIDKGSWTDY